MEKVVNQVGRPITYSTGAWGDQLANTTYDALGNPSYYSSYALTWSGRQLMEMNMNMGQVVLTFAYNDEGIRTSKKSGSVEHIYTLDGSRIVSEAVGSVLLVYLYDESGAPIGLQYRTNSYEAEQFDTYYFEKNIFGDIVAVYTEAGVKVGSYTYDAWGNCTVSLVSGASTVQKSIVRTRNPFRYRGYYYDTETNLYYLQSRYYNPATGRFINADVYINANGDLIGFNMYAYCSNNPVMRVDPTGQSFWEWFLVSFGFKRASPERGTQFTDDCYTLPPTMCPYLDFEYDIIKACMYEYELVATYTTEHVLSPDEARGITRNTNMARAAVAIVKGAFMSAFTGPLTAAINPSLPTSVVAIGNFALNTINATTSIEDSGGVYVTSGTYTAVVGLYKQIGGDNYYVVSRIYSDMMYSDYNTTWRLQGYTAGYNLDYYVQEQDILSFPGN